MTDLASRIQAAIEAAREGFPEMSPAEFIRMFVAHNRCSVNQPVNRIEFEYVEAET